MHDDGFEQMIDGRVHELDSRIRPNKDPALFIGDNNLNIVHNWLAMG